MEDQIRYRITGTVFLLTISIIFLPMFFDGSGLEEDARFEKVPEYEVSEKSKTVITEFSSFEEDVDELRSSVDTDGFGRENKTLLGYSVLTEVDDDTEIWAVQVASFNDEENASQLRNELRLDGYEAFISRMKSETEILNRVAVGPMLKKEAAYLLREEIEKIYSFDARVVGFLNKDKKRE